jgi:hypothetical protein
MVSATDFPKLGKPATAMQVTDPKTGERGYRVGIEVFHQLHCLNLLRMATYPEYYTKLWWSDTNDKPERVRGHLGKFPLSSFLCAWWLFPSNGAETVVLGFGDECACASELTSAQIIVSRYCG